MVSQMAIAVSRECARIAQGKLDMMFDFRCFSSLIVAGALYDPPVLNSTGGRARAVSRATNVSRIGLKGDPNIYRLQDSAKKGHFEAGYWAGRYGREQVLESTATHHHTEFRHEDYNIMALFHSSMPFRGHVLLNSN
jgi:hypothetical protein